MSLFISWYEGQSDAIKAAVIGAMVLLVSTMVTGCFTLISAFIVKPSAPTPIISTPTTVVNEIPTPTQFGFPAAVPTQTPFAIPPTDTESPTTQNNLVKDLENFINSLPLEIYPILLVAIGLSFVTLAMFMLLRLLAGDLGIALAVAIIMFLLGLIPFSSWLFHLVGYWIVLIYLFGLSLIGAIGNESLTVIFMTIIGGAIGVLLGIGGSSLYLAFYPPFAFVYIEVGVIGFGVVSSVAGLIFGSVQASSA